MICNKDMNLIHNSENSPLKFSIDQVISWGVSSYYFTLIVDVKRDIHKIYLESKLGRAIDFIMSGYSSILAQKPIIEEAGTLNKGIHVKDFNTSISKQEMEKQYKDAKQKNLMYDQFYSRFDKYMV